MLLFRVAAAETRGGGLDCTRSATDVSGRFLTLLLFDEEGDGDDSFV